MANAVSRAPRPHGVARAVAAVGRLMITTGVVLLLFVVYQLWGTNLQTNKSQDDLASEFAAAGGVVGTTAPPSDGPSSTTAPTTEPAPGATTPPKVAPTIAPPAEGDVVGRISIPSIGLRGFYIVQGTSVADLKRGAGHYASSPLPGQKGNAAIAGHRTTYGAPFYNIDKVARGDDITVQTRQGTFKYKVIGRQIVAPTQVSVLNDMGDNRLTLTACHPRFSARQRIIISAVLVGDPVAPIPGQDAAAATITDSPSPTAAAIDAFAKEPVLRFPGAWWGVPTMVVWLVVRLLAWRGHRTNRFPRWLPYLVGTPVCLVLLYLFFEAFNYEAFTRVLNLSV